MKHLTGKSQLTHLRCCNIPKNIDRCSLNDMGLSELVSILRRGKRKTRLQASMGLQLRDIQVLCLVLMVVIEPFLCCAAAAAGGVVPRTRMATPAADDDPSVTLTNCFPSVILSPSNIPYTCEVSDAQPLIDLNLSASYYTSVLNPGWPATLDEKANTITFKPDRGAPSGRWELAITRVSDDGNSDTPSNIPYTCEVSDAQPLIDLNLSASYYTSGVLSSFWPATLDAKANTITFMPNGGGPSSGRWELVITRISEDEDFDTPLTTNKSMDFMRIGATHADFATLHPYYGMVVSWAPNLPSGTMASDY
ncbi:hypothetical protein DQ04_19491000, partial [Trypanosoma grayi]|uniref:hypothetical protein n=1 Tax=Trypanosoma grayi TaxID=71804 RepID=UPI0004F48CA7